MKLLRVVVVLAVVGSVLVPSSGAESDRVVAQISVDGLCDVGGVEQFTDVGADDYGAAYISCMRALGLSVGRGDGGFGPDRELTRGQMASFLVRLWRDVLGRACPDGVAVPFEDVAGSVHETNIVCLFGLEITKGTTAVTYGPSEKLKASQIARFLLRTYEKTGGSCEGSGDELERALECLLRLGVIPSKAEAGSSEAVTRAQMAVYVVGLWHNISGRGVAPPAPGKPPLIHPTAPTRTFALVLDASGSMADYVPEGQKIDIAVDAITATYRTVTEELGQRAEVFVYNGGGSTCNLPSIRSASDVWGRSWNPVPTIHPSGSTPSGRALQAAMLKLGYIDDTGRPTGRGSGEIVLVSDGQSNCPPDPCQVVKNTNTPVVVHTVGFLLARDDTAAEQELKCIAQATGGISVTVHKAADTVAAIRPIVREQNVVHHIKNVPTGFTERYSWWRFIDRDTDGLPDKWEENGVFRSRWARGLPIGEEKLDLATLGANPDRKDLFIYYDWEEGARLDEEVLDIVWSVFADAPFDDGKGIWLHFIEGKEIPSSQLPSLTGSKDESTLKAELSDMFEASTEFSGFDQSMWSGYSQRAGLPQLAKYLLIRHPCDPECPFGQAYSAPGNYGVVFMGGDQWCQSVIDRVGYCWLETGHPPPDVGKAETYVQAATVVHVLGHLLGLHDHGKQSCPRVDQSYASVMSHAYTAVGIEQSDGTFLLDYSRDDKVNRDWKMGTFASGTQEDRSCVGASRTGLDNDGSITFVLNQYAVDPDFYLHDAENLRFGRSNAPQETSLDGLIDSVPAETLAAFAEYFGLRQVPEAFGNT